MHADIVRMRRKCSLSSWIVLVRTDWQATVPRRTPVLQPPPALAVIQFTLQATTVDNQSGNVSAAVFEDT